MKKVLLLGAGYGNMGLLSSVNKELFSQAQWTLISNTSYHYKTISLHDVATGKHNKNVLFPLNECLDDKITVIEDTVLQIDSTKVQCEQGAYEYDYLVVGLGFSTDSFGIPGVGTHTQSITSYASARAIYASIEQRLESFLNTGDSNDLAFVICGGGFTGIEFAGSLAQELKHHCENKGIDFNLVKLYCIEAMPKILPMFSENLMQFGLARLEKLGVSVLTNSKILECKENCVVIEQNGTTKDILANTIIWTAGVKGNEVIANSHFFKSGRSKVEVNEWLKPINQDNEMNNIFVIGDCCALKDPQSGRFYPPTAQLAMQQGAYMAQIFELLLHADSAQQAIESKNMPTFSFQSKGSICSIGSGYALGVAGNTEIQGILGNMAKWFVESKWNYQLGGFSAVFKED